ncbi:MAG: pyridoxamine 5'-phosphate oxidase family protein [Treponema sp.]|jgi:nitroimidazol reductase NimA-like FMN-containing flavoprotein (pyridoxamine 5'-phosphate oxidase superfamily)|nr:pyridoxamine 5'-phosphate oxidase family protein [Treponema sp.]
MRRKDREVTGIEDMLGIIRECKVCRLGMADDGVPYVVPLNFGYEYRDELLTLYFHGAREGKKIDILRKNNRVCFEMDTGHQLTREETACAYGFNYASIIGLGTVEFLEEDAEKIRGLNLIMKHQTGEDRNFEYGEAGLRAVAVYRLRAEAFTGKRRELPERRS